MLRCQGNRFIDPVHCVTDRDDIRLIHCPGICFTLSINMFVFFFVFSCLFLIWLYFSFLDGVCLFLNKRITYLLTY